MDAPAEAGPPILQITFNQDASCFAIATTAGFAVFNSDPLKERFRRSTWGATVAARWRRGRPEASVCVCVLALRSLGVRHARAAFDGGLGRIEMLFKCNILAFIGGGPDPLYPRNKVMMWDDYKAKCVRAGRAQSARGH